MSGKEIKGKKAQRAGNQEGGDEKMPLTRHNYIVMLIGFALIVVGFLLMAGGQSQSPDEFNYGMFSFRRITLAPIVALGGFVVVAYGIMKKDRSRK